MSEFTKSAFDPAAAFETDRSDFYADDAIWDREFDDVNGVSDLDRPTGLEHFGHRTSRCHKF